MSSANTGHSMGGMTAFTRSYSEGGQCATAPPRCTATDGIAARPWSGRCSPTINAILALKRRRNAVILGHNYMTPEIFHCVSDIVGDSLRPSPARR